MLDKSGFEKWAGNYDAGIAASLHTFPFIGYYDVLSAIVLLVRPEEGMEVMDIGIGTGLLSEELCRQGCIIHGVDFSAKMLEKARSRIPSANVEAVDVSRDHLGKFNDHKFHRIISSYFFHHLDLRQKTELIRRALNENLYHEGRIIIADVGFETEDDFRAGHVEYKEGWDEDEFYLCGESIVAHLGTEKIKADYTQISLCAGILVCEG